MGNFVTDMGLSVTSVGVEKKSVKHELKKHAATIHCSNTLSLLQRKISNALLYHAYQELLHKEEHEISIRKLCHLIEYGGNNHGAIKEALKGLLSTVVEWNVVNDTTGSEDWTASSMLASVCLQGSLCCYAYSPRMKQLLHSPTMFGKINLYIQSRFKSSYGLALYENCIRYRGLPSTKWFDIQTFRKLMGVPNGNYAVFRDFKRRVLDKSVEEMNTYSDLLVVPELVRERRQVVKVRFLLKERTKRTRLGIVVTEEENEKESKMHALRSQMIMEYHLSPTQAENVLREYHYDFIVEKMKVVEMSKNYQLGNVKNVAAYFLSALKNDYQSPKTNKQQLERKKREEEIAYSNVKELEYLYNKVEKAYLVFRDEAMDKLIKGLDADRKESFMQAFHLYAANSIKTVLKLQHHRYTPLTVLASPQIKVLLREFATRVLPDVEQNVVSIETFLEDFPEAYRDAWHQYKLIESRKSADGKKHSLF